MLLKKGAEVYSAKGDKIGRLNRVIIDPKTRQVTHIVVEKGLLFTDNKIIPIDQVNPENEEMILLNTDQNPDTFDDYEETHFVDLDSTDYPGSDVASSFWYPPVDYAWWRSGISTAYPPMPVVTLRTSENIPEGTIALEEGAKVVSADDKHVGNIEQLIVDPQDNRVTHLISSEGFLFKDHKLIPVTWISIIGENEVRLAVNSGTLEQLPAYQKAT